MTGGRKGGWSVGVGVELVVEDDIGGRSVGIGVVIGVGIENETRQSAGTRFRTVGTTVGNGSGAGTRVV